MKICNAALTVFMVFVFTAQVFASTDLNQSANKELVFTMRDENGNEYKGVIGTEDEFGYIPIKVALPTGFNLSESLLTAELEYPENIKYHQNTSMEYGVPSNYEDVRDRTIFEVIKLFDENNALAGQYVLEIDIENAAPVYKQITEERHTVFFFYYEYK